MQYIKCCSYIYTQLSTQYQVGVLGLRVEQATSQALILSAKITDIRVLEKMKALDAIDMCDV